MQLGVSHPDQLLRQLTARQLDEWKAYYSIEPWGEYRQELRHGRMMQLLDRAHFTRDEPLLPVDFMAFTERPPEPEISEEERFDRIDKEVFGL